MPAVTYPERGSDALLQPLPVLGVVAVCPLERRLAAAEVLYVLSVGPRNYRAF